MTTLRFDAAQRFTCKGCARCCHSDVLITPGERAAYDRSGVARWFRESAGVQEGAARDPFESLDRPGWFRIRRRADGVCGFLSETNRCRIHEELGGARKPLVCRLFPFSLHPVAQRELRVVPSFTCPTILANEGVPMSDHSRSLTSLRREWVREFGEGDTDLTFVPGVSMLPEALETIRTALRHLLDERGAGGTLMLHRNVRRIGLWLEDLDRRRVVRRPPEDFAEYARVMGNYARTNSVEPPSRPPSRQARFFARGFLFLAGVAESQRRRAHRTGLRPGSRWRLVRMLAHAHGLGPASSELDVRARRHVRLDIEEPNVQLLLHHYLRSSIEGLGSGRHPVIGEIALAAAVLNAGIALGAMHAVRSGLQRIDVKSLGEGVISAASLNHLDAGRLSTIVHGFTAGIESVYLLAEALEPTGDPARTR